MNAPSSFLVRGTRIRLISPRRKLTTARVRNRALCLLLAGLATALLATIGSAAQSYQLGPDSQAHPEVPKGEITKDTWPSKIFAGTTRDYWVYVPSQHRAEKAEPVMIFQDGANYLKPDGEFRVPIVFDNLIHKRQIPVTIGIFINPGVFPAAEPGGKPRSNRSFEYDSLGPQYAQFLMEETLPEVGKNII